MVNTINKRVNYLQKKQENPYNIFIEEYKRLMKKKCRYEEKDDESKERLDEEIEARINFAYQQYINGISIEILKNDLEQLYQQELERIRDQEIVDQIIR
jgi:hypothetical protein